MRGELERRKCGVDSHGLRQAIAYALEGTHDAHQPQMLGAEAHKAYAEASESTITRFLVTSDRIGSDQLAAAGGVRVWITGHDTVTGRSAVVGR